MLFNRTKEFNWKGLNMGVYHGNDLRKITGGKKRPHRKVKLKAHMGRYPTETTLGESPLVKIIRTKGGGIKVRLKKATTANVVIPSQKITKKVPIIKVVNNPASRDYTRRGIITKGAIIETELGLAKVVSRPGQDGVVNAVLLEE